MEQLMYRSNKIPKIFFSTLIFVWVLNCYGQDNFVGITKKHCTYAGKYSGEKLIINFIRDTASLISSMDYSLFDFIKLSDSSKLLVIEKLLEYGNDTSLCCMEVSSWSFNGIEGCRGKPKGITRYSIQVDALFMINRLCWPKWTELYSCTPVLYDNKLKKSINNDSKKIKIVYAEYRKWFLERKAKGNVGYYFPFNTGRYGWYGGRKSGAPKD
jgi:hypothetical protein